MALRFDLYRGVYRVSRLLRPRPRRAQRIYFIVHIRSHVRLSIEAFKLLKARHHDCVFVRGNPDQPSAQVELAQHGLTCISLANLVSSYRPGDLVLTFLDWYPPRTLVIAIRMLKKLGARIIGINESFRYTTRTQYKRVELRLTWGPEEPQEGSKPVTIVGSPAIENHLKLQWKPVSPAFALVNYKFDFHKRDSNAAWQKLVVGACQDVGLRTVFSVHPSTTEIPDYIVKTNRDLSDLLPECSVFISPASVSVLEALAVGVPVILAPKKKERLGLLKDPDGAFPIVSDRASLAAELRKNLENPDQNRTRAMAFLNQRISIDPQKPAFERMAETIEKLAAEIASDNSQKRN